MHEQVGKRNSNLCVDTLPQSGWTHTHTYTLTHASMRAHAHAHTHMLYKQRKQACKLHFTSEHMLREQCGNVGHPLWKRGMSLC